MKKTLIAIPLAFLIGFAIAKMASAQSNEAEALGEWMELERKMTVYSPIPDPVVDPPKEEIYIACRRDPCPWPPKFPRATIEIPSSEVIPVSSDRDAGPPLPSSPWNPHWVELHPHEDYEPFCLDPRNPVVQQAHICIFCKDCCNDEKQKT